MTYLSKGMILRPSGIERIYVSRCGREYVLCGDQAKLWLGGRFGIADIKDAHMTPELQILESLGLVELSDEKAGVARYRLLGNCVICQAAPSASRFLLGRKERQIWKWIVGAGFKLRISELVLLMEQNIKPEPSLFGKGNWHVLVDKIYTSETIFDGILDAGMERSPTRDETVNAVLGLLRKKRIILV